MKAENRIDLSIDNKGKGRRFECRFLQAGLVKYSFGVCLLNAEAINKFAFKFVGCPVIIDHKDITDENAKDERVGVISKVWFSEFDGWFWCEGVLFDDEAISLIKDKGYNVSCQYNIDDYMENTSGALHNGNPYDMTILDGTPEHLAIVKNPRYEEALIAVNKGEDMKAENTEFRTGYDSDGDAYVYPLDGADDKKSDKKSDKKDDKAEKKEDKKESNLKVGDTARYNGTTWVKVEKIDGNKAIVTPIHKEDIEKKRFGEREQVPLQTLQTEKQVKENYYDGQLKQSDKKDDKKESKVAETKIIDGGIKESTDKYGRIKFEKGNKWANVTSNGGRSDSWIASYGLTHPSGVSWERKKGVTEEQLLNSKGFKTEKGARKWALEQLKRIASNNIGEFETELNRFMSLIAKNFDESKHKRDEEGKFTDSGNFSGKSVEEQEKELVKELKRLQKNGESPEKVAEMYKKLTGKEWGKKEAKKGNKPFTPKSQKSDSVKFDKIGKVLTSVLKDAEKTYKESK